MTLADTWADMVDDLGPEPDYDSEVAPPDDVDQVNKRLRRLAKVRAEIAQVEEVAAAEIERVGDWAHTRTATLAAKALWLSDGIEMWHRAVLTDDPTRKTISLPCGTLKARAAQPTWEFDEPVFIEWAAEHAPGLVRVPEPKPQVDRAAAKKMLAAPDGGTGEATIDIVDEATGEVLPKIVPGVTVTARPPKFTIDTDTEGGEA